MGRSGAGGDGQGEGGCRMIEVAGKREARLVEGKGSEIDTREKEGANYRDRERN